MGIAVLFPGQGTQFPAMGEVWRASSAWAVLEEAEDALGQPLAHLLLEADASELSRTRNSQLAVLLASLMAWDAARSALEEAPIAFAGHSLGQVTALIASGALTLVDGVRLAATRADCTQAAADRRPGRMAAVIGFTVEQAGEACAGVDCWVANDNAPGQVVLGGTPEGLEATAGRARTMGAKRVIPLDVGAAFHTPLMGPAADDLASYLATGPDFRAPAAAVVANSDAAAHLDGEGWAARLSRHLVSPVRWRESLHTLAAMGARTLVEVGPGSVLSGLARRTVPGVATRNVAVPGDVPLLLEVA